MIKEERSRGKQLENMLDGLTKWLKVGRVIEAMKDRDAWKVMAACAEKHCT